MRWIGQIKFLFFEVTFALLFLSGTFLILGGGFSTVRNCPIADCEKPLLFVHRGLSDFPENSIKGLLATKNLGFNAVEFDIRMTRDGHLVVFHDDYCKRLLGINAYIHEMNFSEIRTLPIIHNGKPSKTFVQTLDSAIRALKSDFYLYLDIKDNSIKTANRLLNIIKKYDAHNKAMVANSDFLFLTYLKLKDEKIITVQEGFDESKEWAYFVTPNEFKADFYSSSVHDISESHIDFLEEYHLIENRIVFDVDKENLEEAVEMNLKHLILDNGSNGLHFDSIIGQYYENK